jgi:hypothetical protein
VNMRWLQKKYQGDILIDKRHQLPTPTPTDKFCDIKLIRYY